MTHSRQRHCYSRRIAALSTSRRARSSENWWSCSIAVADLAIWRASSASNSDDDELQRYNKEEQRSEEDAHTRRRLSKSCHSNHI